MRGGRGELLRGEARAAARAAASHTELRPSRPWPWPCDEGKARFKRAGPPLPHARAAPDAGQLEGDGLLHLLEHGRAVTRSTDDVHCTPRGPRGVSLSRAGVHPER